METLGDDKDPGSRTGQRDAPARPGRSGEGARSALERLLQQREQCEAQRPREGTEPPQRPPATPP